MDAKSVERKFLKINRTLGLMTGVWPYQSSTSKLIGQAISITVMLSGFITQIARVAMFFDIDEVVNNIPYLIGVSGTFVKLGNYIFNESKLKSLIDRIFEDWATIKSNKEYDVMVKYSRRGSIIALVYLLHIAIASFMLISMPAIPPILDLIKPFNESRRRLFIYPAYYGLDPEKYYTLIITHMSMTVFVALCIFTACDTNYVYAVQHACGLLAITRHRFVNACKSKDGGKLSNDDEYRSVCISVQKHQQAVKCLKQIENSHKTYLFISMGLLIMGMSVSLLKVAGNDRHAQWAVHSVFFLTQVVHVFVLTVQGQFVVNALDEVYDAIYESRWYASTPKTQILYVLALRSCLTPPLLTAGGLIPLNLRSYAEIIKASVSYYTVMQSK